MFCPHCGNEIKVQGQRFCSFCGADLTKPAISAGESASQQSPQLNTQTIQPQSPQQSYSAPSYQAPPATNAHSAYSQQAEKKKSKVGVIILSALLVLLLAGFVAVAIAGTKRAEEKEAALHADAVEMIYQEGDLLYEDENITITIGDVFYDNDYLETGDNFFEIDLIIYNKRDDLIVIEASSAVIGDYILSTDHCYCHLNPGENGTLRIYKRQFDLDEIGAISFSLTGTGNVTTTENGHSWNSSNRFIIIPVTIEFEEPFIFD